MAPSEWDSSFYSDARRGDRQVRDAMPSAEASLCCCRSALRRRENAELRAIPNFIFKSAHATPDPAVARLCALARRNRPAGRGARWACIGYGPQSAEAIASQIANVLPTSIKPTTACRGGWHTSPSYEIEARLTTLATGPGPRRSKIAFANPSASEAWGPTT